MSEGKTSSLSLGKTSGTGERKGVGEERGNLKKSFFFGLWGQKNPVGKFGALSRERNCGVKVVN